MRRAKLPLDAGACAQANAAVASQCQRPITLDARDAAMRRQWMDAYVAAGGAVEQDMNITQQAGAIVAPCSKELEPAPSGVTPPASLATGTADYYRRRQADFIERHGGPPPQPPRYYMEYGDKYRERFAALDGDELSPQGLAWRDCTLKKLQELIEAKRAADPVVYSDLELDDMAFKRFAFDSHVEAYTGCGLLKLPVSDLITIASTPDVRDLIDPDGIAQVLKVAAKVRPADIYDIADATMERTREAVSSWFE